jgi:hypothetical protein
LTFSKLSRFWINWKKSKIVWGPLVSLTVRTSAPRPRRQCPIRGHYHYLSPTVPSPHRFHSITSGGYKGSTPRWSTPPFIPPPSLHHSCAALNTVVLTIAEPPRIAHSSPPLTVSIPPQALHRRVLPPQPLGPCR